MLFIAVINDHAILCGYRGKFTGADMRRNSQLSVSIAWIKFVLDIMGNFSCLAVGRYLYVSIN